MEYLKSLNTEQYNAVTSRARILKIIAGAGTGKTQTLTSKIVHLINHDNLKDYQILALTFTNKAAREMKERAEKILEQKTNIFLSTFHKWCIYFLRREADNDFEVINEYEANTMIKNIVKNLNLDNELFKINWIKNFIKKYRYQIFLDKAVDLQLNFLKNQQTLQIAKLYEEELQTKKLLDFDSLLFHALKLLKTNEAISNKWQNIYKAILVDEFQDTDDIQYEIIQILAKHARLIVVGDPDQTIYTWRGAKPKNLLLFDKDYPDVNTVILKQNYRSTKSIVKHSNELIKHNKQRIDKELFTQIDGENDVRFERFSDSSSEAAFVVNQISQLLNIKNINASDCAILYRIHSDSKAFEDVFKQHKIDYKLFSGRSFYDKREIRELIILIKFIVKNTDYIYEKVLTILKLSIGKVTLEKISSKSSELNLGIKELLENHLDKCDITDKLKRTINQLNKVKEKYSQLINQQDINLKQIALEYLAELNYFEQLANQTKYGSAAVNNAQLFLDDLIKHKEQNLSLDEYLTDLSFSFAAEEQTQSQKVNLMTLHGSKGLEFDYVFLVGFSDQNFPAKFFREDGRSNNIEHIEEERRLAYVGMTRARKKLFITFSSRDFLSYYQQIKHPSIFVNEMGFGRKESVFINKVFRKKRDRFGEIK